MRYGLSLLTLHIKYGVHHVNVNLNGRYQTSKRQFLKNHEAQEKFSDSYKKEVCIHNLMIYIDGNESVLLLSLLEQSWD